MGSNSDLRERFNEGCDFPLQGCEFSEGGSSTCSSGTEGGSEDWHILNKQLARGEREKAERKRLHNTHQT